MYGLFEYAIVRHELHRLKPRAGIPSEFAYQMTVPVRARTRTRLKKAVRLVGHRRAIRLYVRMISQR